MVNASASWLRMLSEHRRSQGRAAARWDVGVIVFAILAVLALACVVRWGRCGDGYNTSDQSVPDH